MKNFFLFLFFISVFSQERSLVSFDRSALDSLKIVFKSESIEKKKRIDSFLKINSIDKKFSKDGRDYELVDIFENKPVYYVTDNLGSSITARTNHLYNNGSLGLNIQGQNMVAGVWDSGFIRNTHNELINRVSIMDNSDISNHGTHVGGTIAAAGLNSNLRGIAFNSSLVSYNWTDDLSEMTNEASFGLLVSNHSYGLIATNAWLFGAYNNQARQFDLLANNAPFYTIVKSAGNDRNDFQDPIINSQLNSKFGYDLLKGFSNSKNVIVVGAVSNVSNYVNESSVLMSSFSSWGPTDDGRIKPDVVAKGVSVLSTTSATDTSSGSLSGTSMASPAVAGVCLLLQQHYNNLFSNYMRSATLRGLICHSADEAGFYPGPDYEFGWGLINARRAAQIISTSVNANSSEILQLTLNNNSIFTKNVTASGVEPLMVTICWNDPAPNNFNNGVTDPNVLYLVNDLDIRITKNSDTYYPWTLNPFEPFNAAERSLDNFRDNIEKIQIDNPSGTYSITISHKGSLVGGNQQFSLIISGINQSLSNNDSKKIEFAIYPNPNNGLFTIATEGFDTKTLEIFDIQGRNVFSTNLNSNLNDINVNHLPKGVYMARLLSGEQVATKKIVIQ